MPLDLLIKNLIFLIKMPLPECTPKSPSNSVDIEALNQWMELGLLLHVHINPHLSSHPLVIKHGLLESPPVLDAHVVRGYS